MGRAQDKQQQKMIGKLVSLKHHLVLVCDNITQTSKGNLSLSLSLFPSFSLSSHVGSNHEPGYSNAALAGVQPGTWTTLAGEEPRLNWAKLWHALNQWHRISRPWPFLYAWWRQGFFHGTWDSPLCLFQLHTISHLPINGSQNAFLWYCNHPISTNNNTASISMSLHNVQRHLFK